SGFNYSAAMKSKGGNWSFEELNKFLTNPRGYIPGTAMTFAGLTREDQRADVIDYLHTLADNPVPLPKAAEGGPPPADCEPAKEIARRHPTAGPLPGLRFKPRRLATEI